MSVRGRPRAALLGAALLFGACGRPRPPGEPVALAATLAGAEAWAETASLDLGRPEAGRHLRGGFAAARRAATAPFLLGVGGGSALTFRRCDTRAFVLRLRGWTVPPAGPERVRVTVRVNSARAGEFELGPEPAAAAVEVPSALLAAGENLLELDYGGPEPAAPSGRRAVRVAWDGMRFGDEAPAGLPGSLPDGAGLRLPGRTGIDFFLELEGGARLELDRVVARGGARLGADLACDGEAGPARTLFEGEDAPRAVELRARSAPPAPCRLTLRAAGGGGAAAAIELRGASVRRPAPPAAPAAARGAAGAPPSVLVYLVDTLRADRLGVYGAERGLTPVIDRFARAATVFEHARAQSSWTRPTVASVLTGLDPVRHGAQRQLSRLAEGAPTLAERLRAAGYWTGLATANPNLAPEFGFARGFDAFDCVNCRGYEGDDAGLTALVHGAALTGLDRAPRDRPYFLFVHTVEPHAPYRPSEPFRTRFAAGADPGLGERRQLAWLASGKLERTPARERAVTDLYDAEVALADAGFGAFLEQVARRGRLDEAVVLLLSDHGEELFEHGNVEHGRTLYEEQLRVPMIWRLPRGAHGGRRVAAPVDQLDVAPTVLELAGLAPDAALPGRSLAAALAGGEPPAERPSLAWLDRYSFRLESVAFRRAKLVRDHTPAAVAVPFVEALFDLAADPGERLDVAPGRPVLRGFLGAELAAFRGRWGAPLPTGDTVADEALQRQLRALGYLQ